MRFVAILLTLALCVIMARAGAGECSSGKHQDGDVFCGLVSTSLRYSSGTAKPSDNPLCILNRVYSFY